MRTPYILFTIISLVSKIVSNIWWTFDGMKREDSSTEAYLVRLFACCSNRNQAHDMKYLRFQYSRNELLIFWE